MEHMKSSDIQNGVETLKCSGPILRTRKTLLLMIFFTLLVSSCGEQQDKDQKIDPRLADMVSRIQGDFATLGKPFPINSNIIMGDPGGGASGTCTHDEARKTIIINENLWGQLNFNFQYLLLLHELAHCELRQEHDHSMIDTGDYIVPASIMYPDFTVIGSNLSALGLDYYQQELMTRY